ncbi:MAG: cytochrome c biogenesis protein CcsA [Candidatus Sericytochromatia bacterium]|nr:cytochrome c biogenesis protein CcsA [Candidatus Sericytochromatia bacterium]
MKRFVHTLPWLIVAICLLALGRSLFIEPYGQQALYPGFDLKAFSQTPVLHQGRHQPLDSFARNQLKVISEKQVYRGPEGEKLPAIYWLAEVMSGAEAASKRRIFRIEHDDVLSLMALEPRPGSLRYSLDEILPKYQELVQQVSRAMQKPEPARDIVDIQLIRLYNRVDLYRQIMSFEAPLVLPQPGKVDWLPLNSERRDLNLTTAANAWQSSLKHFRSGNAEAFNQTTQNYLQYLQKEQPQLFPRTEVEQRFNLVEPFYQAMVLFVLAFLLSVFSWMFWGEPLSRSAFGVVALSLLIFTVAMLVRMYLQGRPPVTNLYSSAIFAGWVAVILGLLLEWYAKNGFGTVMASTTGFSALFVAHNLAGEGDTLEMLQAVLDTNFWLATHVTTVTMGYSASFLAGFMGIFLVLAGVLSNKLTPQFYRQASGMLYGTVAFALLFSFVGTVLGGIWADQSWGRFWGWDPKENGAVMIVLWNAIILHARWGGIAKKRGIALLAIGGNIITAWSWFGTNMLGVGLHSYGFMDKAFFALVAFVGFNLLVILLGTLPEEKWRSFRKEPSAEKVQV